MKREKVTTKIWEDTLHKLKLVAVLSHNTMLQTLDRLISQELERLQREGADATGRTARDQQD
jgi:hypothetical protein